MTRTLFTRSAVTSANTTTTGANTTTTTTTADNFTSQKPLSPLDVVAATAVAIEGSGKKKNNNQKKRKQEGEEKEIQSASGPPSPPQPLLQQKPQSDAKWWFSAGQVVNEDTFERHVWCPPGAFGFGTSPAYGGHLCAVSMAAAAETLSDVSHLPHSLHAHFLRGAVSKDGTGLVNLRFEVERVRDGRSFSTRRVLAYKVDEEVVEQDGKSLQPVFATTISFHRPEPGVAYPPVGTKRSVPPLITQIGEDGGTNTTSDSDPIARTVFTEKKIQFDSLPRMSWNTPESHFPVDIRQVPHDALSDAYEGSCALNAPSRTYGTNMEDGEDMKRQSGYFIHRRLLLMRPRFDMGAELFAHRALAVFASDWGLCSAPINAVGYATFPEWDKRISHLTSLDHAIWFHAPEFELEAGKTFLYECNVQAAGGGRGLCSGRIFCPEGRLVAVAQQEGLIRVQDEG